MVWSRVAGGVDASHRVGVGRVEHGDAREPLPRVEGAGQHLGEQARTAHAEHDHVGEPAGLLVAAAVDDLVGGQCPAGPFGTALLGRSQPPEPVGALGRVVLDDGVVPVPEPTHGISVGQLVQRRGPGVEQFRGFDSCGDHPGDTTRGIGAADPAHGADRGRLFRPVVVVEAVHPAVVPDLGQPPGIGVSCHDPIEHALQRGVDVGHAVRPVADHAHPDRGRRGHAEPPPRRCRPPPRAPTPRSRPPRRWIRRPGQRSVPSADPRPAPPRCDRGRRVGRRPAADGSDAGAPGPRTARALRCTQATRSERREYSANNERSSSRRRRRAPCRRSHWSTISTSSGAGRVDHPRRADHRRPGHAVEGGGVLGPAQPRRSSAAASRTAATSSPRSSAASVSACSEMS